jgi:hypothetical protein
MPYFKRLHSNVDLQHGDQKVVNIIHQWPNRWKVSELNLDLSIGTLHENLCIWLFESWEEVKSYIDMIIKGWESVDCQGHLKRISKWKQIQKFCVLVNDDNDILKENIKDQNFKNFLKIFFTMMNTLQD